MPFLNQSNGFCKLPNCVHESIVRHNVAFFIFEKSDKSKRKNWVWCMTAEQFKMVDISNLSLPHVSVAPAIHGSLQFLAGAL